MPPSTCRRRRRCPSRRIARALLRRLYKKHPQNFFLRPASRRSMDGLSFFWCRRHGVAVIVAAAALADETMPSRTMSTMSTMTTRQKKDACRLRPQTTRRRQPRTTTETAATALADKRGRKDESKNNDTPQRRTKKREQKKRTKKRGAATDASFGRPKETAVAGSNPVRTNRSPRPLLSRRQKPQNPQKERKTNLSVARLSLSLSLSLSLCSPSCHCCRGRPKKKENGKSSWKLPPLCVALFFLLSLFVFFIESALSPSPPGAALFFVGGRPRLFCSPTFFVVSRSLGLAALCLDFFLSCSPRRPPFEYFHWSALFVAKK
ncbi:hypothetical protein psal_cds_1415 [Pandoravirus salinus]|uniref:Transmembrane protein n=1 Tax=Pandoravirus salinus TaxID=1349410 RepID=S4W605_9VIRU|nr:hypothetical protein psal_cds_1415 [Pandoravirus salinus]AGO85850.1 hypothetical protein psal_cds_1415 [Pandoravirus salinus]